MTMSVWAPAARRVELLCGGAVHELARDPGGWWSGGPAAEHGQDYAFRLDGGPPLPDPRSRWQPGGVHGPSRVYDHGRFAWTDTPEFGGAWRGRALPGSLTYELHVGTFTPEGTFDTAIGRLDHLVDLGVDLVELLPVAAFPGRQGWGYDGVALFAVHEPYGGPDGLKRFVDAAHARGLGVVLDAVYNHLGPSGNYLPQFGPYFTDRHHTPWGAAVNLDDAGSDEVRRFVIDSALAWLRDFHVDGLRLDAVHALRDDRATHLLEEMQVAVESLAAQVGRPLFLVAESDRNDPRTVTPREAGGYGLAGQWDDDVHHALHALLTGERQGYYCDFGSYDALAKVLTRVFLHDGTWSTFRGRTHGAPVDTTRIPGHRFVVCLQNHDQVGNRATGDRNSATLSDGLLRVGAALLLTAPYGPMLFMGEEWGASTPWRYFTDHQEPELADAVRDGRRREFASHSAPSPPSLVPRSDDSAAAHGWAAEDVPDPQDPATFEASKLDWSEPGKEPHAGLLAWHRELIALRRAHPDLTDARLDRVRVDHDEKAGWIVVHRGRLRVAANLAGSEQAVPLDAAVREILAASAPARADGAAVVLPPESVAVVSVQREETA